MLNMIARDPLTNEEFIQRRSNQKFATPDNRIAFHNRRANKLRESIREYTSALHRNLKILNELMEEESEARFHKQFLIGKGFNFSISTHVVIIDGQPQLAIYDFAYIPQIKEQIKIIKTK
jgi:hypothetical protein